MIAIAIAIVIVMVTRGRDGRDSAGDDGRQSVIVMMLTRGR